MGIGVNMPKPTIKVEIVKRPPEKFSGMLAGIRTKEEAAHWAEKNGFTVVYFLPNKERVYAQEMSKACRKARALEEQSLRLVAGATAALNDTEDA